MTYYYKVSTQLLSLWLFSSTNVTSIKLIFKVRVESFIFTYGFFHRKNYVENIYNDETTSKYHKIIDNDILVHTPNYYQSTSSGRTGWVSGMIDF